MSDQAFLAVHGTGRPGSTAHVPTAGGYWRCVYDDEGRLVEVEHVRKPGSRSGGLHLYLDPVNEMATLKTPSGLSGLQWVEGRVYLGTVWDDDDGPGEGREVGLEAWVEECLARMGGRTVENPRD